MIYSALTVLIYSHYNSTKNKQIKKLLSSTKSSESIWEMLPTVISKLPFRLEGKDQRIHVDYHSCESRSSQFTIQFITSCYNMVRHEHLFPSQCQLTTTLWKHIPHWNKELLLLDLIDGLIGYASIALELSLTPFTHLSYCMCGFQRL